MIKTRNSKNDRRRGMVPKRQAIPVETQEKMTPEALARMERIQDASMKILEILDGWTLTEAVMLLQTTANQINQHLDEFRNTEVICAHPEETVTENVTETEPEFKSVD